MAHMPTYFTHPSYLFRYPHRLMRTSLAVHAHTLAHAHTHTLAYVCLQSFLNRCYLYHKQQHRQSLIIDV